MWHPWAPPEHLRSPSTAARPSLEKRHLCKSRAEPAPRPRRPARQPTARTRQRRFCIPAPSPKKKKQRGRAICAPKESCPRCLEWLWRPARRQATLRSRGPGPAEVRPSLPKRAPAGPRSGNPPRARRPHSPLTFARRRARERGLLRLPHALGAERDEATGCRGPAGRRERRRTRRAGGGTPPLQRPLRHARSPRKVWLSEGWRRGGGGAASPPCPALPQASGSSHGRAPPTG